MENSVKTLKEKIKKEKQKERKIRSIVLQNVKVMFPTHTTNVYHHTFIQLSDVLMSSEFLLNFTSL